MLNEAAFGTDIRDYGARWQLYIRSLVLMPLWLVQAS